MGLALSVTVLGCDGSYPGPGGACSGYLVEDGETRIWLDAGSGTLANLQQHAGMDQIDAVVITHDHPDHWTDLEGYHVALRHVLERQGAEVYAPAGLRERAYQETEPYLVWNTVGAGDGVSVGGLQLSFSRTDHGPETLAVRVDSAGGQSLGYSADTGPDWSIEALGRDLDLVLYEATLPRSHEGKSQHLSARQAGEAARHARARRLVLTHLWPTLDPREAAEEGAGAFGSEVSLARAHARYEI